MSERVSITMSISAFDLLVTLAKMQGEKGVLAFMVAKMTGAIEPEAAAKATKEMEEISNLFMRVPTRTQIEESTADIYAITVPQTPGLNPEYQAKLRDLGAQRPTH